ncbi:MAG TPA: D-alanyl-D-alanine carboxypeptidase/D-alanyl-D-alanine-endopeptidase [Chitinophagaceae bacterium]|nr:D-alanyl-D-alanine carboxypeptidase/D-alanyl-D-alanine-endopeptidase [Chitinophagaceae bacterium]
MRSIGILAWGLLLTGNLFGQSVAEQLQRAFRDFQADSQLRHALVSLYVTDARSGAVIFDVNGNIGMAPASTQKVFTAAAAFDLLGRDFRYHTDFAIDTLGGKGRLVILASGDPTLGSWRWEKTRADRLAGRVVRMAREAGWKKSDTILVASPGWAGEPVPDGWIWQDLGNYYGAGASSLNWRENQYDLLLVPGRRPGDPVRVKGTDPVLPGYLVQSLVTTAPPGTGDNAYIYLPGASAEIRVRGTVPAGDTLFRISGSLPDPARSMANTLVDSLLGRPGAGAGVVALPWTGTRQPQWVVFDSEVSPTLDSMVYWFLKRSINLYGEAFVKTMGWLKTGQGGTGSGTAVLQNFWQGKGVETTELNLYDGSGLSPQNRVTTHAQVLALRYASRQPWFASFLQAFPVYHGMTMKSGSINDVKGFCGFHTSRAGITYIFSFLVNNYNGPSSLLVSKMYRVLDALK